MPEITITDYSTDARTSIQVDVRYHGATFTHFSESVADALANTSRWASEIMGAK